MLEVEVMMDGTCCGRLKGWIATAGAIHPFNLQQTVKFM
jgi:hypothetical protein